MNSKLLKELKDDFLEKKAINDQNEKKLNSLIQRKELLENTRIVKDYIELCHQVNDMLDQVEDEKQMFLHTLFDYERKGLVKETNGIFLYSGTYIRDCDYVIRVRKNDSDAEYDEYIDIESLEEIIVPVKDRAVFEKEHMVIALNEDSPIKYSLYELHHDFMYDSVIEGQEKACQKILKK